MFLNTKKTRNMKINFTKNYQFSTRLDIKGGEINTVETTKLLGTTITKKFKWDENTKKNCEESKCKNVLAKESCKL